MSAEDPVTGTACAAGRPATMRGAENGRAPRPECSGSSTGAFPLLTLLVLVLVLLNVLIEAHEAADHHGASGQQLPELRLGRILAARRADAAVLHLEVRDLHRRADYINQLVEFNALVVVAGVTSVGLTRLQEPGERHRAFQLRMGMQGHGEAAEHARICNRYIPELIVERCWPQYGRVIPPWATGTT